MTIEQFVQQLCEHCGVDLSALEVRVDETEEVVTVNIALPEEDSGRFIGFHGETLESLQRIIRVIFMNDYPNKKIVVNINEYREEREKKLQELTRSVAQRVLESGEPYTFQSYLPSHERYTIHATLSELEEADKLESISEGVGKDRRLTIRLKS